MPGRRVPRAWAGVLLAGAIVLLLSLVALWLWPGVWLGEPAGRVVLAGQSASPATHPGQVLQAGMEDRSTGPRATVAVPSGLGHPMRVPLAREVTAETDLAALLDTLRAASDPEDRAESLVIPIACSLVSDEKRRGVFAEQFAAGTPQRARFLEVFIRQEAALRQFCQGGDSQRYLDEVMAKRLSLGKVLPNARGAQQADPWPWQAMALANPEKHSATVDRWLDSHTRYLVSQDMSWEQGKFIADELYRRITGDTHPRSIRNLARCALQGECPGVADLDRASQAAALAEADRLERLIREQRWSELQHHAP